VTGRRVRPVPLRGTVVAPPSKSYTHRAAVLAHLSERPVTVHGPLDSEDTRATLGGLVALGARVERSPGDWRIDGRNARLSAGRALVRCGSSGTTLRFLVSVAALREAPSRFVLSAELSRRPVRPLLDSLQRQGARVRRGDGGALTVYGPIRPGRFRLETSLSSQFLSSLLQVLPRLDAPSEVVLSGATVSAPYVEATAALLRRAGARLRYARGRWRVDAPTPFTARRFSITGDASSAAPLWVGAAISGGAVEVSGIDRRWPQADLAVLELLTAAGAGVRSRGASVRVEGGRLQAFRFRFDDCPDLLPLAGVVAAFTGRGSCALVGARHASAKESDRVLETARLARALGARVEVRPSEIRIRPGALPKRLRWETAPDHRVVMAAAVAATGLAEPSRIAHPEAVRKSYPGFWSALGELGARP
jgi:3-phosphoshikimate 1-carboxyvinyltransferase